MARQSAVTMLAVSSPVAPTALAAASRHDGAAGTGPHTQTEAVHTGPTAVVRLESPLALGHGYISSTM